MFLWVRNCRCWNGCCDSQSPVCPDAIGDLKELRSGFEDPRFPYVPGRKGMAMPGKGQYPVWF